MDARFTTLHCDVRVVKRIPQNATRTRQADCYTNSNGCGEDFYCEGSVTLQGEPLQQSFDRWAGLPEHSPCQILQCLRVWLTTRTSRGRVVMQASDNKAIDTAAQKAFCRDQQEYCLEKSSDVSYIALMISQAISLTDLCHLPNAQHL